MFLIITTKPIKLESRAKSQIVGNAFVIPDLIWFLDASTHLYMRVCPSVGRSVTLFFLIAEIDKKQHRIIGKVEPLFLDCNNLQKKS